MSSPGPTEAAADRWPLGVRGLALFAACLAAAFLAGRILFVPDNILPFWPYGGVMLGALLAADMAEWPMLLLASVSAGGVFAATLGDGHPLVGATFGFGNFLEAALGAWFLRRMSHRVRLDNMADLFRLLFVSGCLAGVGAASSLAFAGAYYHHLPGARTWALWWSSDALGLVLFAPLVIAWGGRRPDGPPLFPESAVRETLLFFLVLLGASAAIFGGALPVIVRVPYPALSFPLVLWAATRLPTRVSTAGAVTIAVIAAGNLASGDGALWVTSFGHLHTFVHLQVFLAILQICALFSNAAVARLRSAEARVHALNENLERSVLARTAELEESRSSYRELASIAPVGIFRMDAQKQIVYVNEKWCDMTGISPERALGRGWLAAVHPMDRGRVTEHWAMNDEVHNFDFRFGALNAEPNWVLAECVPRIEEGRVTAYIGCLTDITALKRAEMMLQETQARLETGIREATAEISHRNEELSRQMAERDRIARELLDSESTLRAFFQSAPMMMGIVELMRDDIFFVSVNAAASSTLMAAGSLPAAGRTVREMGWTPEEIEPWLEKFRESEQRRQPMRLRTRRMIGGQEREFVATVSFLGRSAAGQPRYCYVAEDITESARSQETTERFRAILEATTDMVGMADKFGRLFYINGAGRDLLGLAPDEPLTGLRLPEVHAPWAADLVALEGLPVAMIEGAWQGETAVISRNGPEVPASELILAHKSPSGSVEFLSTIIRDMSEQKEAEVRIKASLEEKEVLLKEIHHRVKNNLQIVSSLLQLQASYIKDTDALHIFEESRDRIKSMALIHEQLYQSNDLAQIDFPEYMRSLLNMVLSAHRSANSRVETRLHVDPISLDLDTAIPVGLITNELVTNSLKYAFIGRSVGEIGVRLTRSETGEFVLMVSDNGVGLPEKFNFDKATSLGLRLVRILTKQMRARLELSNGMGTQFRVYFKSQSNA
jgi:PAS domain S-box-containing protein